MTKYCPVCLLPVRYVTMPSRAYWVHTNNTYHVGHMPTRHDVNTFAPHRLVELPERLIPLIADGIVATESCPEQHYWHWLVLKPELLPADLRANYEENGEIRWYLDRE